MEPAIVPLADLCDRCDVIAGAGVDSAKGGDDGAGSMAGPPIALQSALERIEVESIFRRLRQFATEQKATIVTGSASVVRTPFDLGTTFRAHNSATVFGPNGAEPGRYDKIHLVYFGETVPRFSAAFAATR